MLVGFGVDVVIVVVAKLRLVCSEIPRNPLLSPPRRAKPGADSIIGASGPAPLLPPVLIFPEPCIRSGYSHRDYSIAAL